MGVVRPKPADKVDKPPRGGKITRKRSKTFTGCSTCRSRGVKCGEEKPTCLRCKKLSLECGGYGVALVWPGSKEPTPSQRRMMLTGRESCVKAISDDDISSILATIDAGTPFDNLAIGLFGVFPISRLSCQRHRGTEPDCEAISPEVPQFDPSNEDQTTTKDLTRELSKLIGTRNEKYFQYSGRKSRVTLLESLKWRFGLTFLEPSLYDSVPIKCREERQLLHYWVTHLSPLMLPTEQLDNPFTSILIPLALGACDGHEEASGRKALLHSLYSLSAFSRANCCVFPDTMKIAQNALGKKYLRLAFEDLGRSLVKANHERPEAVLATILALTVIGIFTENYSNFRIHLRGGAEWIQSIDKTIWKRNLDASAIYQMFTTIEALRPAHSILARDLEPQAFSLDDFEAHKDNVTSNSLHCPADHNTSFSETTYYCLDGIFSLTKPILECIMEINRIIFSGTMPTDEDFVALEFKIMASNPQSLHFSCLTPVSEEIAHHNACSLYCATYIYYKCSLLRMPPSSVQWLVRRSVEHLDAIQLLSEGLNVSGFLWPLFITACEAEDGDLRAKTLVIFEKRKTLGIANVTAARKVVDEVWRRRDEGATGVWWHEVMAEMSIDILLS